MNDQDASELWKAMEETTQAAVDADRSVAGHAHVPRGELRRHIREDHGVVGESRTHLDPVGATHVAVREEVLELDALAESQLRASHWRMHTSGFVPHRTTEVGR
jgi:phosphate-selective porin